MTNHRLILILFSFLLLNSLFVKGQSSVVSGGGNASGSQGSVSISIGEVFNAKQSGNDGSHSDGIQQPYDIKLLSAEEHEKPNTIQVFPNPVTIGLNIEVLSKGQEPVNYQLTDIGGRVVAEGRIERQRGEINTSECIPGNYVLKCRQSDNTTTIFNIIKH